MNNFKAEEAKDNRSRNLRKKTKPASKQDVIDEKKQSNFSQEREKLK